MKLSTAKKICDRFDPVVKPDGKYACRFMLEGEFCKLPKFFRCEIKQWTERKEIENAVSVSRINTLQSCPRQFWFRYVAHVGPEVEPEWAIVGKIFAAQRARIDRGWSWEVNEPGLEKDAAAKLRAVLRCYENLHFPVSRPEIRTVVEHKSMIVQGYLDGLSPDNKTIYEWKYSAIDDNYDRLTLARQLSVYFAGIKDAEEAVVGIAKKSTLRIKETESEAEFEERVFKNLSDKGNAFTFKTFKRENFDIEGEFNDMLLVLKTLPIYEEEGKDPYPANTHSCNTFGGCSWKSYCVDHVGDKIPCADPACRHSSKCKEIAGSL